MPLPAQGRTRGSPATVPSPGSLGQAGDGEGPSDEGHVPLPPAPGAPAGHACAGGRTVTLAQVGHLIRHRNVMGEGSFRAFTAGACQDRDLHHVARTLLPLAGRPRWGSAPGLRTACRRIELEGDLQAARIPEEVAKENDSPGPPSRRRGKPRGRRGPRGRGATRATESRRHQAAQWIVLLPFSGSERTPYASPHLLSKHKVRCRQDCPGCIRMILAWPSLRYAFLIIVALASRRRPENAGVVARARSPWVTGHRSVVPFRTAPRAGRTR